MQLVDNFVLLFIESAPYLLLGMLIAGLIHQLLPKRWVEQVLGSNSSVVTAAVIGAPLPLCSCSVIPVAMGIRRSGASKASTASFLVSTPETGVDSIGITYALMGPAMAIARPIAAIFSAIVTVVAVAIWGQEQTRDESVESVRSETRCCHSQSDCESESKNVGKTKTSVWQHIRAIFAYGFDSRFHGMAIGWFILCCAYSDLRTRGLDGELWHWPDRDDRNGCGVYSHVYLCHGIHTYRCRLDDGGYFSRCGTCLYVNWPSHQHRYTDGH